MWGLTPLPGMWGLTPLPGRRGQTFRAAPSVLKTTSVRKKTCQKTGTEQYRTTEPQNRHIIVITFMSTESVQAGRRPKARGTPRVPSPQREVCPKCGSPNARIIGRSESLPILYFRCEDCRRTSVGPAV